MVSTVAGAPQAVAQVAPDVTPQEAMELGEELYVYAAPLLDSYRAMFQQAIGRALPTFREGFNRIWHAPDPLTQSLPRTLVEPDILVSVAWVDVRMQPVVFDVPAINDRYFSVQFLDLFTHNVAALNGQTVEGEASSYLLAGPDWTGARPNGLSDVIQFETGLALAVIRVDAAKQLEAARAVQQQFDIRTLSEFTGRHRGAASVIVGYPVWSEDLAISADFLPFANSLRTTFRPIEEERSMIRSFRRVGFRGWKQPQSVEMPREIRAAMEEGIAKARARTQAEALRLGTMRNGWRVLDDAYVSRSTLDGRYLTRAGAARLEPFGMEAREILVMRAINDVNGDPIDTSKHAYVIEFDEQALPPVSGLWSITAYDAQSGQLVRNILGRHSIGHPPPASFDGVLPVHVSAAPPALADTHWLPAPEAECLLVLRLYLPDEAAVDGRWEPPSVRRVE
jgi:hypothetical protein